MQFKVEYDNHWHDDIAGYEEHDAHQRRRMEERRRMLGYDEKKIRDPLDEMRHDIRKAFDSVEKDFQREIATMKN